MQKNITQIRVHKRRPINLIVLITKALLSTCGRFSGVKFKVLDQNMAVLIGNRGGRVLK